jgi:predicted nuclease with TOPRIM domain
LTGLNEAMKEIQHTDHFELLEKKIKTNLINELSTLENRIRALNDKFDAINGDRSRILQSYQISKRKYNCYLNKGVWSARPLGFSP